MSKMKVLICIGDRVITRPFRASLGFLEGPGWEIELSSTFHFSLSSFSMLRLAPRVTSSTEVMAKAVKSLSSSTVTSWDSSASSPASNFK